MDRKRFQEHRIVCESRIRVHIIFTRNRKRAFSKVLNLCFTSKPDRAYMLRPLMDRKMDLEHRKVCKSWILMGIIFTRNQKSAFSKVLKLWSTSKPDRAYVLRPSWTGKWIQEHRKLWKSRIRVGIIITRNRKSAFLKILKLCFTHLMLIKTR